MRFLGQFGIFLDTGVALISMALVFINIRRFIIKGVRPFFLGAMAIATLTTAAVLAVVQICTRPTLSDWGIVVSDLTLCAAIFIGLILHSAYRERELSTRR